MHTVTTITITVHYLTITLRKLLFDVYRSFSFFILQDVIVFLLCFPTYGVPQGSTLGPTLFSAFINDLPSVLPSNSTILFADDTTIFLISDNIQELNSSLQLTLDLANSWLQQNGLKLNISKTKRMLIHSARKKVSDKLALKVETVDIEQVHKFKFLGVVVNDTLSWDDHIELFATRLLVVSAFYVASLGFSLGLFFFFTLNHTFFPY